MVLVWRRLVRLIYMIWEARQSWCSHPGPRLPPASPAGRLAATQSEFSLLCIICRLAARVGVWERVVAPLARHVGPPQRGVWQLVDRPPPGLCAAVGRAEGPPGDQAYQVRGVLLFFLTTCL